MKVLDNHWLIRVVVTEPGKESFTEYVSFIAEELKNELIPSNDQVIDTLKVSREYPKKTVFNIKGISAMLDIEIHKWPEVIQPHKTLNSDTLINRIISYRIHFIVCKKANTWYRSIR